MSMETVLNIFQILVAINGFVLFETKKFYSLKYKIGMAIAGITLIISSIASYNLIAWYPLFIGYGLLFVYKFLGLEASIQER
jgi:hypothetical protein